MGYFRSETHRDHLLRCFSILTFRIFLRYRQAISQGFAFDREMWKQSNILSDLINQLATIQNISTTFFPIFKDPNSLKIVYKQNTITLQ